MNTETDKVINWDTTLAAVWRTHTHYLKPVNHPDLMELDHLLGIDAQKQQLIANTDKFLSGIAANHVLLWGARGTGKSSLVKALLNQYHERGLRVIEIPKDGLHYLLDITDQLRELPQKFIIFCDDISFSESDSSYIALKSTLEGSIEKPPANVLMIATSNRRHMVTEKKADNLEASHSNGELHLGETIDEKMSLVDRFGLSLSFYPLKQEVYLEIVDHYFADYTGDRDELHILANRFSIQRGTRSGRVAKQFYIQHSNNP